MDSMKKRKVGENGVISLDSETNTITVEDARKITESLNYEQLLGIVQNAAVRYIDVLDAVRSFADADPSQRKLFIRGLGWDTTTEKLRNIFSVYGELAEAVVILDKATGKSKGYGFITFKHVDGALLALKEPSKSIDGRMTITQLASAGITPTVNSNPADVSARKIYVANVPYDMTADRLLAHFSMYGEIEEGPFGFDKVTGKSKGFALMVYKTEEAASASLVDSIKNIDGHQVNCKLANDWKKGKPEAAPGGVVQVPTGVPAQGHGDGIGMHPPVSMPGSQFAGPGVISSYGAYSGAYPGGLQGQLGVHSLNSSLASGPGFSSLGSHTQSSLGVSGGYGSGLGGPYGGFGGPGITGYGGIGSAAGGFGGAAGGFGGGAGGFGGVAGGLGPAAGGLGAGAVGFGGAPVGFGGAPGGFGGASGGFGGAAVGLGGAAAGGLGGSAGGLGGSAGGLGGAAGGLGDAAGGLGGAAGGLGGAAGGLSAAAGGLGSAVGGLGSATGGLLGTGGGLGGAGAGFSGTGSGLGGAGRSSSLFGGPTSAVGMASGGYPESAHYSLSGSGYQSQYNQTAGTSPVPRVPPGRMYQGGMPPYY